MKVQTETAAENVVLEAMQPPHPSVAMLRPARAESQTRIARLRLRVSRQPQ